MTITICKGGNVPKSLKRSKGERIIRKRRLGRRAMDDVSDLRLARKMCHIKGLLIIVTVNC